MCMKILHLLCLLCYARVVYAQDANSGCYGTASIALSVILTLILGCAFAILAYFLWKKYWKARKGQHLILETDPETGKGEYAFDNPGYRDAGLTPLDKSDEIANTKSETNGKTKWNHWYPLGVLTTKNEKKRTLDDSELQNQIKNVSLRSHDFTGLGFNICGNMKEGIFIKDILHRGPASESKKLNAGDRIQSVTISFQHMVYEDALAILGYASPYEIVVSVKNGKAFNYSGQVGRPLHPVYRSSSNMELNQIEKSGRKLLFDDSSDFDLDYSSLQKKGNSMVPTLERSKPNTKTTPKSKVDPIEYKEHLRMKPTQKIDTVVQKQENKFHKFGVQVLPPLESPTKSSELTKNVNNTNHERQLNVPILSIDEVDKNKSQYLQQMQLQAPPVKKREKLQQQQQQQLLQKQQLGQTHEEVILERNNSGIKRDQNNIPLEIPSTMLNAAVAARNNRKSLEEEIEEIKSPKKKGKAPPPPELNTNNQENQINNTGEILKNDLKAYNSDSDVENDNQSSVNTIELNASDITIHQSEENDEKQNRKTASTGDLSKIHKPRKNSTATLERAQSLDITDTGIPALAAKKRKGGNIDESKTSSNESLFGSALVNKEPRLSIILDGLNTFQRSRLKKSTEWGNLEDAIFNLDKQGSDISSNYDSSEDFKLSSESMSKTFNFGPKLPEFDALVNKINEIKQETMDIISEQDKNIKEAEIAKEKISHIIKNVKHVDMEPTMFVSEVHSLKIENEPMPQIVQTVGKFEISPVKKHKNNIWPLETEAIEVMHEVVMPQVENKFPIVTPRRDIPYSLSTSSIPTMKVSKSETSPETVEINIRNNIIVQNLAVNTNDEPIIVNVNEKDSESPILNLTEVVNFLDAEREASARYEAEILKLEDINIPDDIKVSRHTLGTLENPKNEKNIVTNVNINNISNIIINHQSKYDSAINKSENEQYKNTNVTTPDILKSLAIAEAIHDLHNEVTIEGPTSLSLEIPSTTNAGPNSDDNKIEIRQQNGIKMEPNVDINKMEVAAAEELKDNQHSLTYITEIQVTTPQKSTSISEIEIDRKFEDKLDENEFEQYIKNFESNIKSFENNIHNFEANIQSVAETIKNPNDPINNIMQNTVAAVNEVVSVDPEKELQKVHELVEEQLKKLPEMRFSTSSYESQIKPPEQRQSQIEILRSNFEKSNIALRNARSETSPPKSRIPVLNKTPPTSPERRDSRNLENEQDAKDILEMMASKYPNKNVTVTSIRTNSRIPSGLPTYSSKPPVPPKKSESTDDLLHISSNGCTGNVESFRQWVFNPSDQSGPNFTVPETKYDHNTQK